ncbi:FMN-dependent NADH-azoreductase [Vibrio tapetis]|uniref:FMN dependent NADH:quinone oxidoreductase n=1 Tax=Vibrio tapetis subsp. tapetis TaxID=1671868 RepID=A0A2N8ZA59_9VIBR|nr:FMN-dependent NADH-azoreductase [Vibrio tapetis]SON48788.1 NADH-azoreductase, FMN-dependent [Vibrio tapetis subsp. tapetis]
MSRLLVLKSSILGGYSQSNQIIEQLTATQPGEQIIERDLVQDALPMLDMNVATALRGGDELSPEQQEILALSNTLIEEIKQSDTLIIAAPMYNFTVPTQLKNWVDMIARAGVTFAYTEQGPKGLLENKKAIVVTTRGGIHKDAATDIITPYLTTVLGFVGITNVEFVYAEALNMGDEMAKQGLDSAKEQLSALSL